MESLTVASLFLVLANLIIMGASSAQNTAGFLDCLTVQFQTAGSNSDHICTMNNTSYSSIFRSTARNERPASSSTRRPLVIVSPTHVSEIQATIHCSKKHDVQVRVRSGGHDYEGLSYVSEIPFAIVDMTNFRSISINSEDDIAWVETGATLGQMYYTIAQASKTLGFPAGVCPSVGVGGHFTGGGYGMMSRKHGIALDHIIDARVIDAKGRILDRESMGEDHFWAIRGGGGNSFGIVLAFKVKLVRVPEIVTVFNVTRTLERNATQLVHKWQYISDKIDENLLMRIFLTSVRSPISSKNRTIQASFTSLFLGPIDDLLPIMRSGFPELGLEEQDCIEMSWIESVLFFADLGSQSLDVLLSRSWKENGVYFKGKSDYVTEPIPEHGLEGFWKFLDEEDENTVDIQFSPYGGILSRIPEDETPFPHRSGNIYIIYYAVFWTPNHNNESERHMNWIRNLYDYLVPYVSKSPRAAYFNYRDLDIGMNTEGNTSYTQARVWGFKYFKNNFNRLVHVKTKVDPSNFFRNEQSVPPLLSWYDSFLSKLNLNLFTRLL